MAITRLAVISSPRPALRRILSTTGTGGDWVLVGAAFPCAASAVARKRNKTRPRRARAHDFVCYIIRSNFESTEIWNKWAMHPF